MLFVVSDWVCNLPRHSSLGNVLIKDFTVNLYLTYGMWFFVCGMWFFVTI